MSRPEREGTHDRPRSALNLRLALATFGMVVCAAFAAGAFLVGLTVLGVIMVVLAVIAVIDIVVVGRRIAARRRRGEHHTLFE
jgi:uncharacterized membrane protein